MKIKFERFRQWENHLLGKYFLAYITQDLFGGWHLVKTWGKVGHPSGRLISAPCSSQEEALYAFQVTHKRRLKHGYQPVYSGVTIDA